MGWPIDTNFTTFVNYNAVGPSTPGAADLDRLNAGVLNLANPPYALMTRSDVVLIGSSETFNRLQWRQTLYATDPGMIVNNSTGNAGTVNYLTDRIYLPYPGEWSYLSLVRAMSNNTGGYGQLAVSLSFNSTYPDVQLDTDTRPQMANIQWATTLRCVGNVIVTAAQVAAGAALVVDYAQNSGGINTIVTKYPAYPRFQVRAEGKGGQP